MKEEYISLIETFENPEKVLTEEIDFFEKMKRFPMDDERLSVLKEIREGLRERNKTN